jgi:hypothetical protein
MALKNKELFYNMNDLRLEFLYPKLKSLNDEVFHHLGFLRNQDILRLYITVQVRNCFLLG